MARRSLPVLVAAALAAVVVLTAAPAQAGGGCHAPLSDGRGTTVVMQDLCFEPMVLRTEPGRTVTWVNRDSVEHPVVGVGDDRGFAGGAQQARFDRPGVYPYFCHVHLGMIGVVVVGDSRATAAGLASAARAQAPPAAPASVAEERTAPWPGRAPLLAGAALLALAAALAGWRARAARHPRSDDRTSRPAG
ncbi:MAG TPA: hypothetical protein VKG45_02160 [Actinomycetes bacterium]|nr:hypothetical protein [Actinomycetes bacterium]